MRGKHVIMKLADDMRAESHSLVPCLFAKSLPFFYKFRVPPSSKREEERRLRREKENN